MPRFFDFLAKEYNPSNVDDVMFSMHVAAPRCVPIVCTDYVDESSGKATVDGVEIGRGQCIKFDFSPVPLFLLPVGDVARECGKEYRVRLEGFRSRKGKRFPTLSFLLKTKDRGIDDKKHVEEETVAKEIADDGIVLLENNGLLPLRKGSALALCGDWRDYRLSAVGSSMIKPRWALSLEEALGGVFHISDTAETAVFVLSRRSGENIDNRPIPGEYYLSVEEKTALAETFAKYPRVILILNTGYPIEMRSLAAMPFSAVLWTGFSGQRGTESLRDILCGEVNPSGRLADAWPWDYFDLPSSANFIHRQESDPPCFDDGKQFGARLYYEESVFVGYRYFDSFGAPCAFAFGHGLSYSSFSKETRGRYSNGVLSLDITVKNLGGRSGKEAALVYVSSPDGRLRKARRVLAGFEKTKSLSAGEAETLHLDIPAKDFSVYDDGQSVFLLERGEYGVWVGGSLAEARQAFSFALPRDVVVERTAPVCRNIERVGGITEDGRVESRSLSLDAKEQFLSKAPYAMAQFPELAKGKRVDYRDVLEGRATPEALAASFSAKELARFAVCDGSCWHPKKSGAAGRLPHSKRHGIPTQYMSDGNCSVHLNARTTGYPCSNMVACTFDKRLAYRLGAMLGREAREFGIAILLGPGGNLHRDLLCGRHPEYFSEDPILSGTMMAFQARGQEENGALSTYKHLFANGSEWERKSSQSVIDERAVRELYLRVFEKALSLYTPACFMTSYNSVNGIYPCENKDLLVSWLREERGFQGMVMTDWGSCDTADPIRALGAGTNLITPGDRKTLRKVIKAMKKGMLPRGTLQASAAAFLRALSSLRKGNPS